MNNYTHQNGSQHVEDGNVVLVGALYDGLVGGSGGTSHLREGVERSVGSMFRDFEEPKRRHNDNGTTLCAYEECRAYPMKADHGLCVGHARKEGLLELTNPPKEAVDA